MTHCLQPEHTHHPSFLSCHHKRKGSLNRVSRDMKLLSIELRCVDDHEENPSEEFHNTNGCPTINETSANKLAKFDCFVLTLMKLRLNLSNHTVRINLSIGKYQPLFRSVAGNLQYFIILLNRHSTKNCSKALFL